MMRGPRDPSPTEMQKSLSLSEPSFERPFFYNWIDKKESAESGETFVSSDHKYPPRRRRHRASRPHLHWDESPSPTHFPASSPHRSRSECSFSSRHRPLSSRATDSARPSLRLPSTVRGISKARSASSAGSLKLHRRASQKSTNHHRSSSFAAVPFGPVDLGTLNKSSVYNQASTNGQRIDGSFNDKSHKPRRYNSFASTRRGARPRRPSNATQKRDSGDIPSKSGQSITIDPSLVGQRRSPLRCKWLWRIFSTRCEVAPRVLTSSDVDDALVIHEKQALRDAQMAELSPAQREARKQMEADWESDEDGSSTSEPELLPRRREGFATSLGRAVQRQRNRLKRRRNRIPSTKDSTEHARATMKGSRFSEAQPSMKDGNKPLSWWQRERDLDQGENPYYRPRGHQWSDWSTYVVALTAAWMGIPNICK
ncbi:uncharacterized protein LOC129617976 [Condylostylus longicornis]|uniref:uncharacterized protein LOC129617976 n=1 Tax=Condylostylus longicornis TaxID=2530218 RepID=UPI00244E480B|nr:uncharacterized protein LOC129617976 [Condylostylus longicornis]